MSSSPPVRNNIGLVMYSLRENGDRTEVRTPHGHLAGFVRDGRSYDGTGTLINGRNGNIAEIVARLDLSEANLRKGF